MVEFYSDKNQRLLWKLIHKHLSQMIPHDEQSQMFWFREQLKYLYYSPPAEFQNAGMDLLTKNKWAIAYMIQQLKLLSSTCISNSFPPPSYEQPSSPVLWSGSQNLNMPSKMDSYSSELNFLQQSYDAMKKVKEEPVPPELTQYVKDEVMVDFPRVLDDYVKSRRQETEMVPNISPLLSIPTVTNNLHSLPPNANVFENEKENNTKLLETMQQLLQKHEKSLRELMEELKVEMAGMKDRVVNLDDRIVNLEDRVDHF
jgi:hypothetical protein